MANRMWIVFSDSITRMEEVHGQRFVIHQRDNNDYGIFYNAELAMRYAVELSRKNPSVDVQVFEATKGFYSPPPAKTITKEWTPDGEFLPV